MKKFICFLVFIIFINIGLSQTEQGDKPSIISEEPVYYQDFLNFYSEKEGTTRVDIYIHIPYKSIQFVKSPQGFTAKYAVTVTVFDSTQQKMVVEKSWNETINVMDFNQTISRDNYNLTNRNFELKPGNYFIRTHIEDKDSKREFSSGNKFKVRDIDSTLNISDVMLISGTRSIDGTSQVIPNISRNIVGTENKVQYYYEIFSTDSVDQTIFMKSTILKTDRTIVDSLSEVYTVNSGRNQIISDITSPQIDLGTYFLNVKILNENRKEIYDANKQFFARWLGLPANIVDIDKAVDQMVYIASPDELDYIREAEDKDAKLRRFLEFWKSKDPSPNNDENEMFTEYYNRVKYANDNFSSYREGWKSDRGMVFIILGAPNNIDRHPFEYYSKPYEVWEYYNINRRFVFIDETGFGDYRLTTPLTGDLFRYRP